MSNSNGSYRSLEAWKKSFAFANEIYTISKQFPQNELFALTSQIRRAAVSIPSNIAEGYGRDSAKEFSRYLSIANGSLCEVETQLEIAFAQGYITLELKEKMIGLSNEIGRIIRGLRNRYA